MNSFDIEFSDYPSLEAPLVLHLSGLRCHICHGDLDLHEQHFRDNLRVICKLLSESLVAVHIQESCLQLPEHCEPSKILSCLMKGLVEIDPEILEVKTRQLHQATCIWHRDCESEHHRKPLIQLTSSINNQAFSIIEQCDKESDVFLVHDRVIRMGVAELLVFEKSSIVLGVLHQDEDQHILSQYLLYTSKDVNGQHNFTLLKYESISLNDSLQTLCLHSGALLMYSLVVNEQNFLNDEATSFISGLVRYNEVELPLEHSLVVEEHKNLELSLVPPQCMGDMILDLYGE
ncbi:hypothetical protein GEMRC1_006831 [Eukaryota sp. GEM-RC1]